MRGLWAAVGRTLEVCRGHARRTWEAAAGGGGAAGGSGCKGTAARKANARGRGSECAISLTGSAQMRRDKCAGGGCPEEDGPRSARPAGGAGAPGDSEPGSYMHQCLSSMMKVGRLLAGGGEQQGYRAVTSWGCNGELLRWRVSSSNSPSFRLWRRGEDREGWIPGWRRCGCRRRRQLDLAFMFTPLAGLLYLFRSTIKRYRSGHAR